jgi:hypothetical protein
MSWPAMIVCFLFWLAMASPIWLKLPVLRAHFFHESRKSRTWKGLLLFLCSIGFLLGGFALLSSRGASKTELNILDWIQIAITGGLFVVSQSLAAVYLLSLVDPNVTNGPAPPSNLQNLEGKDS